MFDEIKTKPQSERSRIVTRRTYNRPLTEDGTVFETWEQTTDRVIGHQKWLWERAKGSALNKTEEAELEELRELMLRFIATPSGRTLWLGGTEVAKRRELSQFNCTHKEIRTIHDVVDSFWGLLQGAGVGFTPVPGILNGFTRKVQVEVIRSQNRTTKGHEKNRMTIGSHPNYPGKVVAHLIVGDSAEAWAKSVGKILALKTPVDVLLIDFSEIRAAGIRLKGYGWISSGDVTISKAMVAICRILNERVGQLLTAMDILDLMNWLGTTLSSRRSAEIALFSMDQPEIDEFIVAKKNWFNVFNKDGEERTLQDFLTPDEVMAGRGPINDILEKRANEQGFYSREQRQQSNNSIVFRQKPSREVLEGIFDKIMEAGGSEPGFINAQTAIARAAWWKGTNPCAEIALSDANSCNLFEVDWAKLIDVDPTTVDRILWICGRANYRQTCVNLRDGILQDAWHEINEFLRLCGVGATGIVQMLDHLGTPNAQAAFLEFASDAAHAGANSMADELNLPRPKAVTTVKPSGTLSKIMDTTEGVHRPLGRYIFNNVTFGKHDPAVPALRAAGYKVIEKPFEPEAVLVTFPVAYEDVAFHEVERDGEILHVNLETAVEQLERYKLMMNHYVRHHNCSITVSYDPSEVPEIIDWILDNWDTYVGVSFLYRNDPTKTAADLGYAYLPQEVVTKAQYEAYVATLRPVDLDSSSSLEELAGDECASGACPIR